MRIKITQGSQNILKTGYITIGSVEEQIELHITMSEEDVKSLKKGKVVTIEV